MSTNARPLPGWWTPDLAVAGPNVDVFLLNQKLRNFVLAAAAVHEKIFDMPLVITSGNDGQHVASSAHYKNAAVDLRSIDKDLGEQMIFGMVLNFLGVKYGVGVFDERATTSKHWHAEDAALLGG